MNQATSVVKLYCRCVYNRAAVSKDGTCEGCGDTRVEAWHAGVLAGRVGRLARRTEEVEAPRADETEEGTLWNYEEDETE